MEDVDLSGLEELFRERFFHLMLRRERVRPETVERMRSWPHSGFHVDAERKLEAEDREGLQGLLSYMERPPVALRRLTYLPDGADAPGGVFSLLARDSGAALFLDDLQWADNGTLEILTDLTPKYVECVCGSLDQLPQRFTELVRSGKYPGRSTRSAAHIILDRKTRRDGDFPRQSAKAFAR